LRGEDSLRQPLPLAGGERKKAVPNAWWG
jgi:hypothetical protein